MKRTILKGAEVMLFVDGATIALATSCSLEVTTQTQDVRTKDSAYGPDKEFDFCEWSLSSESLVGENEGASDQFFAKDLLSLQLAGTPVDVVIGRVSRTSASIPAEGWTEPSAVPSDVVLGAYRGRALVMSSSVNAPAEGKTTFSVKLDGSGELKPVTAATT